MLFNAFLFSCCYFRADCSLVGFKERRELGEVVLKPTMSLLRQRNSMILYFLLSHMII